MSCLRSANRSFHSFRQFSRPTSQRSRFPQLWKSTISRRWQQHNAQGGQRTYFLPPVHIVGPAIVCISSVFGIYMVMAGWSVYNDTKEYIAKFRRAPESYRQLEIFGFERETRRVQRIQNPSKRESDNMTQIWHDMSGCDQVIAGLIAANVAIFPFTTISPKWAQMLAHMPVSGKNYTAFTSMFVHGGLMHIGLNMYALYNFGSVASQTATFMGSGPHFLSFYLSAGLLASFGAQLEALAPSRRFYTGVGASGAIMALVGFFGMTFPDARIGLIFVPGRVDASTGLGLLTAFELYGAIFGFRFIQWGHSVHLAGLAVGAGYAYFDKTGEIWRFWRMNTFKQLRRVGAV